MKGNVVYSNKKSLKKIYEYMLRFPGVRETDLATVCSRFEKRPKKIKKGA